MSNPVRGQLYTLREVYNLNLRDSPHLGVVIDGNSSVVQDSHVTTEEMLSVPGFADTKWEYIRETHEWIPIFRYAKVNPPITDFVDYEPENSEWALKEGGLWVTPKGFTREQYTGF